ncbi:hypothetical protein ART_2227 [Arthrobacter sp. PAMC 25486]|uniref:LamG-like jellyroll fold domain-containing protein n=1 Tax=Arthrobacter sp. PAMC 25486 TaxID=1494608 RepID=UPI000535BC12|nr:LamG-like jellyroll fold domain-containing protein [Arthrobacter sp. PAMC 25486]AIY01826.1 hypothetical protein ART_2227 [Arthrobacter sp. PAMC 25486]
MTSPTKVRGLLGLATAAGLGAALLGLSLVPAAAQELPVDPSHASTGLRSTIAILPDTQFYSRYATEDEGRQYQMRFGNTPFESQTNWIVENQDKYGIAFTEHLGDIVDQADKPQQWQVASDAMEIMEDGGANYQVVAGNHDVHASNPFLTWFPESRDAQQKSFGGRSPSGFGSFHRVIMNGEEFLSLGLSWDASDADIDWAQQVLDANPAVPTIFTSHQLIDINTDTSEAVETDFGTKLWDRLISTNRQIFLTYNGHHHGATEQVKMNNFGEPVIQQLLDYQMAYQGGNGYMGLVEFNFTNNVLTQTSFSPWVLEKPADTLTDMDTAFLYGAGDSYSMEFDFAKRFASFAPDFAPSGTEVQSYSRSLRNDIRALYTDPVSKPLELPSAATDYPEVDGTVAHWRMAQSGTAGTAVPEGGTVKDLTGLNDFSRADLNSEGPVRDAVLDDVKFSADHAAYSSDAGSVCFSNTSKHTGSDGQQTNRMSYFLTADGAPVNAEKFSNGYTMETFIKIDPSWTAQQNAWMTWLGRDGVRKDLPGYGGGDEEEPPMAGAISSLREVQWAFTDTSDAPRGNSNWSSDVDANKWLHLAIVDDPAAGSVTLFVDGAPVLRNVLDKHGINGFADMSWVLGGGSYDGVRGSGFLGCIGETRIVDHALPASQWLTARAPQAEQPSPTAAPTETAAPTATATATPPSESTAPAPVDPPSPSTTAPAPTDRPATPPALEPRPTTEAAAAPHTGPARTDSPDAPASPDQTAVAAEGSLANTGAGGTPLLFGAGTLLLTGAALLALHRRKGARA